MKENEISKETVLKVAKEITIKFIETGRITPTSFDASFKTIYHSIEKTVKETEEK